MKYLVAVIFISFLGSAVYGMDSLNGVPSDDGSKTNSVRTLEISYHLSQLGNRPVYTEIHEMAGLNDDLRLGEGQAISGSWTDIPWRNQIVYIQIAEKSITGVERTALSIMRYTAKGLKIKKIFNDIPDMQLDFFEL